MPQESHQQRRNSQNRKSTRRSSTSLSNRRNSNANRQQRTDRAYSRSGNRDYLTEQPRREQRAPRRDHHQEDGIRLQKVLAQAGFGSRRKCEQLILDGRVEVDGDLVLELGTRVNPDKQRILVDGSRIHLHDTHIT